MDHSSPYDTDRGPTFRIDRRVMLKAAASFAAMSAVGIPTIRSVSAQSGGTLAGTWVEAENVGAFTAAEDLLTFQA
ncbi:MAG: hypothetical protein H0T49_07210, partial [Chloroflexia bacterium]|nr:hypothetical protein [Chloroflexia bacterium]